MGCGDGLISQRIAAAGIHIVGIDQSETMLALARRQAADEGISAQAEYVLATLPLSDEMSKAYENSADLIISSSVMEYVDNYEKAIRQFHSILKSDGILLLSLPNQLSIYRVFERVLQKLFPLRDSYLQHQRHQFNPARTKSLLISLGFDVIEEEYFSFPWQRFTEKFLHGYRGRWIATMLLFTMRKA
jgi:2-polyprenyl-6-hydroxyphenyl methylase/3-demethylubiquinone-9 3-methyltransferase